MKENAGGLVVCKFVAVEGSVFAGSAIAVKQKEVRRFIKGFIVIVIMLVVLGRMINGVMTKAPATAANATATPAGPATTAAAQPTPPPAKTQQLKPPATTTASASAVLASVTLNWSTNTPGSTVETKT